MKPRARMSKQELAELIKSIEEGGGDTTDLKALLAEVESDERKRGLARKPQGAHKVSLVTSSEEETAEERLNREVGYLFSDIPFEKLKEYDYRFTLKELRAMCKEAGLSTTGHKKLLAAKLIAKGTTNILSVAPEVKLEKLTPEVYGKVYTQADEGWELIGATKLQRSQAPYWEEFRDIFENEVAKQLKEGLPLDLLAVKAKDSAIGIMFQKYPNNFPKVMISRWFRG